MYGRSATRSESPEVQTLPRNPHAATETPVARPPPAACRVSLRACRDSLPALANPPHANPNCAARCSPRAASDDAVSRTHEGGQRGKHERFPRRSGLPHASAAPTANPTHGCAAHLGRWRVVALSTKAGSHAPPPLCHTRPVHRVYAQRQRASPDGAWGIRAAAVCVPHAGATAVSQGPCATPAAPLSRAPRPPSPRGACVWRDKREGAAWGASARDDHSSSCTGKECRPMVVIEECPENDLPAAPVQLPAAPLRSQGTRPAPACDTCGG